VDTRGWMGGVSRRVASSFMPEMSICSASETPNKSPSLTRLLVREGLHTSRRFVKARSPDYRRLFGRLYCI
jgi:hypothetical protein